MKSGCTPPDRDSTRRPSTERCCVLRAAWVACLVALPLLGSGCAGTPVVGAAGDTLDAASAPRWSDLGRAAAHTPRGSDLRRAASGPDEDDDADTSAPAPDDRWHIPRRRARNTPRPTPRSTEPDGNPLAGPSEDLKLALENLGITNDLELGILGQRADDVISGSKGLATFIWLMMGDWEMLASDSQGKLFLTWIGLGSSGLGHDTEDKTMSSKIGSISGLDGSVFPDAAVVDELALKYVSHDESFVAQAGKIDMSFHFDTNPAANNVWDQFLALALELNLSIPFPLYGGFGGFVRQEFDNEAYVMLGIGDSAMNDAIPPWNNTDQHSWYELGELGIPLAIEGLGKGTVRVIPWHNKLDDENGWGVALNADQELGDEDVIGFFRAGAGDDDVTPVQGFLSGGVSVTGIFEREHDTVGVGFAWSDPSADGQRSETLIESYYRFQVTPTVMLTPDVQFVWHPAANRDLDRAIIGGLRLILRF